MKLAPKLTLVFLLLSLIPMAVVGYLAYDNSRQTIEQNVINRLTSTTLLKEAEFNRWLENNERQLRELARRPLVRDFSVIVTTRSPGEASYQAAHADLLADHLKPTLEEKAGFLELSLLHPQTGQILVSSDPGMEGKYRENQPYFLEGKEGTYVDQVRYSLQDGEAILHVSTPIKSGSGELLAVLSGHVDLSEMDAIMRLESGLSQSEDSYLVNDFNFFISEPKFGQDFALKKAVQTQGVKNCLTGQIGVDYYPDYRGIPVIGAYRWMPEHRLCIVNEIDQAEAFASIQQLQNVTLGTGVGVAIIVALLGLLMAYTITNPVERLVKGVNEVGRGNLDYHINVTTQDEIGELAVAFNQMTARRKQIEQELNQQQLFLESIYEGAELAIFVIDVTADGDFRFAGLNPAHERMSGMKSAEVEGKTPEELVPFLPLEAASAVRSNYSRCLEQGRVIEYEEMIPMGDREIWWLTRLTPLRDTEGRIYRIVGTALEISKRKQMEDELRRARDELELRVAERTAELKESEARYRTLTEASPDMIFVINRDDTIEYVNTLAAEQFGGQPDNIVGQPRSRLFPPQIAERQQMGLEAVFARGQSLAGEDVVRFPNGEVWLNTRLIPLTNGAGEVTAVMGVSRDVTAAKQAEAAVKESEEKYRQLAETAQDIILTHDLAGNITYINRAGMEICQYSLEEIYRLPVSAVVMPGALETMQERRDKRLNGDDSVYRFETELITKNGQQVPLEVVSSLLKKDGKPDGVLVLARDMTYRKEAELALKENERILRQAQRIAHLGSWEMNIASGESKWSDEFFRICGFEPNGFTPTADIESKVIHPDDWETAAQAVQNILENGQEYRIEKRIIRPSGEIRHVLSQGEVAHDDAGNPVKLVRTFVDITERKEAELALAQKAEELVRSNQDLEQFAYVASHDLQEPLRMVTSYLQLLERRYAANLDDDAHEFIAYAVDGASRMKRLINDLLAYSRVGTRGKAFALTDCEAMLAQTLADLQLAIEDNQATITHDPLPTVLGDANQLQQLLQNLISNGLKFRSDAPPKIHVGVEQFRNHWQFSVQDNGIGIAPEYVEKIFIIFQRLHGKKEYPGTGIGLAICKKIVERHNGRIWIESEAGNGATFYFTLPVADAQSLK